MLKLASFAGMGSNGIADDTPLEALDSTQPTCSHCNKPNDKSYADTVWETMQFCNESCLGKTTPLPPCQSREI